MRIESTLQLQSLKPTNPSGFHEGASSTAEKITALAATLLAAAASFFVLPVEAAVFLSSGFAILFSTMFCGSADNSENSWDLGQLFSRSAGGSFPTRQSGFRNIPGTGHNPLHHQRNDLQPNPILRRHPNAQDVLAQHGRQQMRPNVQPQLPPQRQHVPIGRGNNRAPQQQQQIGQPRDNQNQNGARLDQRPVQRRAPVGQNQ